MTWGRIQRKTWCMGPYAGAIISPYFHSRVDSNTFTMAMGNPMPESTSTLWQSQLCPPVRDFVFSYICFQDCVSCFLLIRFLSPRLIVRQSWRCTRETAPATASVQASHLNIPGHRHRHSGIRHLSPAPGHSGTGLGLLIPYTQHVHTACGWKTPSRPNSSKIITTSWSITIFHVCLQDLNLSLPAPRMGWPSSSPLAMLAAGTEPVFVNN